MVCWGPLVKPVVTADLSWDLKGSRCEARFTSPIVNPAPVDGLCGSPTPEIAGRRDHLGELQTVINHSCPTPNYPAKYRLLLRCGILVLPVVSYEFVKRECSCTNGYFLLEAGLTEMAHNGDKRQHRPRRNQIRAFPVPKRLKSACDRSRLLHPVRPTCIIYLQCGFDCPATSLPANDVVRRTGAALVPTTPGAGSSEAQKR